jgi:hypothetical protein
MKHGVLYRAFQEEESMFWELIVSPFYAKMCFKMVDKKEKLRTASNTGIYC